MPQTLTDFAHTLGLTIPAEQLAQLEGFAALIWQKKDFLNLTSAADLNEVLGRHVADGFLAVAEMRKLCNADFSGKTAADAGAGAGYIGFTTAILLPQTPVTLIESIEKRCSFMNWAALKLGLCNVRVINARIGEKPLGPFDYVTQRAMGQLQDVLPLCAPLVKEGGAFIAYQGENAAPQDALAAQLGLQKAVWEEYRLPSDGKTRKLAIFKR